MSTSRRRGAWAGLAWGLALEILAVVGLSVSAPAQADERLFPTDVLHASEVDVQLRLDTELTSRSLTYLPYQADSSYKTHATTESVQARHGLGDDTHVGASLSYQPKASSTQVYGNVAPLVVYSHDASGVGPLAVWIKHRFVNGARSPLTLSGELDLVAHPHSNVNTVTHATLAVQLVAGWDFGGGLKSYVLGNATLPNKGLVSHTQTLEGGVWIPVGSRTTLTPYISSEHLQASSEDHSRNLATLGLNALIDVAHNTYVIPGLNVDHVGAYTNALGNFRNGPRHGKGAEVFVYHLY